MKLEDVVNEIKVTVATIRERLDHTVTWKELAAASVALFIAICSGVWFLVGLKFDSKLHDATTEIKEASTLAVTSAKEEILKELLPVLGEMRKNMDNQSTTISEVSALVGKQFNANLDLVSLGPKLDSAVGEFTDIKALLTRSNEYGSAYVAFDTSGQVGSEILQSTEWKSLAKTLGINSSLVETTGQIILPIGTLKINPNEN
jgi:hypothetical protein